MLFPAFSIFPTLHCNKTSLCTGFVFNFSTSCIDILIGLEPTSLNISVGVPCIFIINEYILQSFSSYIPNEFHALSNSSCVSVFIFTTAYILFRELYGLFSLSLIFSKSITSFLTYSRLLSI